MEKQIKELSSDLNYVWSLSKMDNKWDGVAKFVLRREIESEIKGLVFCFPDLKSESGITIRVNGPKDFALRRKIELENQLKQLDQPIK